SGEVQFGSLKVSGPALARIGTDGQLLGLAPAPGIPSGTTAIATDAAGNVVVAQFNGMVQLFAYDATFHERWSSVFTGTAFRPNIAAAGDGYVAMVTRGNSTDALLLLEPDGSQRWSLPLTGLASGVWMSDDGDIHVYTRVSGGS